MTKDYKNDKRSKANQTKRQAQKNAQDIQSLWRKNTNKPSATVNERSSTTSPAVAASTSGGAEVREVSAVQNRLQANEFASSNNEASARNRPSPNSDAPPSTVGGSSEPPDPPDPPGDDPEADNNEEGRGVYEDGGDGSGGDDVESNPCKNRQYWPPHMYKFFEEVRDAVDNSAKFKGRGSTARFEGTMPLEYQGIASPFVNPEVFFKDTNTLLPVERFVLPHVLVWLPELLYGGRLYPGARPKCKFHNCTACVNIRGWVPDPRHCYTDDRWIALMGKVYECNVTGETFRG